MSMAGWIIIIVAIVLIVFTLWYMLPWWVRIGATIIGGVVSYVIWF